MRMKLLFILSAVAGMALFLAAPAVADWNPGDGHKMHYPQLPNPIGWDVSWSNTWLGDDWQCSQTGPVGDIHFWLSYQGYNGLEPPAAMANAIIQVQIWSNNSGTTFSHPETKLWERDFAPGTYSIRHYGSGDQGWLWPSGNYLLNDHDDYFQINIKDIVNPLFQEKGNLYWLVLKVPSMSPQAGWKTSSSEHFMDDAVRGTGIGQIVWNPLEDPLTGESLDFAFVITPEPGTFVLLLAAGLGLGLFAWKRRK